MKGQHPRHAGARIVRVMRVLSRYRGWDRLANALVPPAAAGAFCVRNETGLFAGDLSSFIDRSMYLRGAYEAEHIRLFLNRIPPIRCRTILDIGANVGTHSLAFARHFKAVHAFEVNPALWSSFEENMKLNGFDHVTLHRIGLADRAGELTLHLIEKNNFGLGTLSTLEQYDLPLKPIATVRVATGDSAVADAGIDRVDAMKIDVQGFEREVLAGLVGTLARDRPFLWTEVIDGTETAALKALIPYRCVLYRFAQEARGIAHAVRLHLVNDTILRGGDYLAEPDPY